LNDAFFCRKATDTYVRLQKERDYHRMHHKRVVQEKNRLVTDLRRLRDHYACYEPALRTLKTKYETAMKEKMLTKLERDRVVGEVQGLKSALKTKELTQMSNGTCTPNGLPGVFAINNIHTRPLFILLALTSGVTAGCVGFLQKRNFVTCLSVSRRFYNLHQHLLHRRLSEGKLLNKMPFDPAIWHAVSP